jgi:hypothetical protein
MQILNQPSDLLPWSSPTYIPGAPHNLPKREQITTSERSGIATIGESVNVRNNYQYASLVTAGLTVGTTSIKFLDQPIGKRNLLSFRNASAGGQTIYIEFNAQATTTAWLALTAGTIILFDAVVPQDDLYAIASGAGGQLAYAYSTYPG